MGLWNRCFRKRSAIIEQNRGLLDRLAVGGAEVVIFVPKSKSGKPCVEAMQLEGGRIPIKLAESIPLPGCNNIDGCDCEYRC